MKHAGTSWRGGLLLAALAALSALGFAPAPEGSADERIVFASVDMQNKKSAIVIMNPDGSHRTTLTKGDALELDPVLSRDGKRIAFVAVSKADMRADVWVMKADGSDRQKLTNCPAQTMAIAPCWSHDGKRITYTQMTMAKGPGPDGEVMVMDADGKNAQSVGKGLISAFSPDGKKIAYAVIEQAGRHEPALHVMDADGKNDKELVKGVGVMAAWSPDGKHIAFAGGEGGGDFKPHIHVCKADGSEPRQLTNTAGEQGDLAPRWSADGKRIYFNRLEFKGAPGKSAIHVMDADGGNEKKLTKGDEAELLGSGSSLFLLMTAVEVRKP